jgi:hypothetical protein
VKVPHAILRLDSTGMHVTDSVRHIVAKRYPGLWGRTPVFTGVTKEPGFPLRGNDREEESTLNRSNGLNVLNKLASSSNSS